MEQKQNLTSDTRFALLIDSDNVSAKYIKPILDELSKYGSVTYKRCYGDWTSTLHAKWKDALLENSITPIQQFSYTYGKNATDSAMIIDAMDILYTDSVEGFCIVSSDSDFTRLASRLRESGRTVIGMGEKKTPKPFRRACDIFTTLELLEGTKAQRRAANAGNGNSDASDTEAAQTTPIEEIEAAVVKIITDNQNRGKSTGLGEVGSSLQKRYPDFDVRSYGTNLLSKLLSGFKSVAVIKNGSNVDVVLADEAGSETATPASSPAAETDSKVSSEIPGIPEETAEAAEEKAEQKPEGEGKSRNRRRRRNRSAKTTAETAPTEQETETAPEEHPATEPEAEAAEPAAADAMPAEPAKVETAPEKKTIKKSADQAEEDKPRKKPAAKKQKKATAPQSPEDFAKKIIADAGAEGILMSALGKRIRSKYRDFKVKDLGFSQLRLYIASLKGVSVRKIEGEYRAFAE